MLEVREADIDRITELFHRILKGEVPSPLGLPKDVPDNEVRQVVEYANRFVAELQQVLKDRGIGILRVEKGDVENLTFTLTVAEDLDCSGLPTCGEQICTYDEGFISGLLSAHTGKKFRVKEVDCWCSGDRVCRFDVKPVS